MNSQEFVLAAESSEEMNEWITAINLLTRTVNDKINLLRTKEKQLKIANELSSLVVYCQAVPFNIDFALQDPRKTFYEMCSFSESKHEKLLEKGLIIFNLRQLSRVYPHASRLTSSNFNPIPMWNSGCHMVFYYFFFCNLKFFNRLLLIIKQVIVQCNLIMENFQLTVNVVMF